MSLCGLCNRNFGSEKALKQHEENSPKHAENFGCKACNRSFKSLNALGQHQDNSPAHRKTRKDSVVTSSTSVPAADYARSPLPTTSSVRHQVRNSQRNGHATTKNTSHTHSTFDLPFAVLKSRMQALNIPEIKTIVTPPKIDRAHVHTRQETRTFFTFPELHQRIAEAVAPTITSTWFNPIIEAHFNTEYETNVMGNFTCENKRCRKSQWSSKVVAVWIKGYPRSGYNAMVYNQRCKSCDRLGSLKLDEESYVERIAYRLKKWAGVTVEMRPFSGTSKGPHEIEHCEGCKAGHCSRALDF
jgi:hypothetical protein